MSISNEGEIQVINTNSLEHQLELSDYYWGKILKDSRRVTFLYWINARIIKKLVARSIFNSTSSYSLIVNSFINQRFKRNLNFQQGVLYLQRFIMTLESLGRDKLADLGDQPEGFQRLKEALPLIDESLKKVFTQIKNVLSIIEKRSDKASLDIAAQIKKNIEMEGVCQIKEKDKPSTSQILNILEFLAKTKIDYFYLCDFAESPDPENKLIGSGFKSQLDDLKSEFELISKMEYFSRNADEMFPKLSHKNNIQQKIHPFFQTKLETKLPTIEDFETAIYLFVKGNELLREGSSSLKEEIVTSLIEKNEYRSEDSVIFTDRAISYMSNGMIPSFYSLIGFPGIYCAKGKAFIIPPDNFEELKNMNKLSQWNHESPYKDLFPLGFEKSASLEYMWKKIVKQYSQFLFYFFKNGAAENYQSLLVRFHDFFAGLKTESNVFV
jgi:hypothetical protein